MTYRGEGQNMADMYVYSVFMQSSAPDSIYYTYYYHVAILFILWDVIILLLYLV
jgi:hypothetical protein